MVAVEVELKLWKPRFRSGAVTSPWAGGGRGVVPPHDGLEVELKL